MANITTIIRAIITTPTSDKPPTRPANNTMHAHNHDHSEGLGPAVLATALFAIIELTGGWLAGSLALLADAAHMFSDVGALLLALLAGRIAQRPAHAGMSFGYGRARVLAAQANGLALWFLSGWIAWEAADRLTHPPDVQGWVVLWIALAGLALNLIVMRWLGHSHDINVRASRWHVLGDALGSAAAVIAGLVIIATGWMGIDPLLSFAVAAVLAWGGWRLVRETTLELMEATPPGVDPDAIVAALSGPDGVLDIHHLHIWRLPAGGLALSAHVRIADMREWPRLLEALLGIAGDLGIGHATLQPETRCHDP